jgi:hypothetical protein
MDTQTILAASKKTAMSRKDPTVPQKLSLKLGLPSSPVLDWGCGKGADTRHLKGLGYEVFGYDPNYQPELPDSRSFGYAQCFYVLNVLPGEALRVKVLQEMKAFLSRGATVCIAARPEKEIKDGARKRNWEKIEDGWMTPKGTFQKGLNPQELKRILQLAGFINIVDHSNSRCTFVVASI